MAWPAWPIDEDKALARYVLPETAERVRLAIVRDDEIKKGDRLAVVRAIYEALAASDFRYAREMYAPDDGPQLIRDPGEMLTGGGDATCLDLALLFAGVCLGHELLPLVVIVEGHAFVAVSLEDDPRKPDSATRRGRDGVWVDEGVLLDGNQFGQLIAKNGYVPVECTGFAKTETLADDVPEGRGRKNGKLDFEAAIAAGRSQCTERQFRFAVDPALRQRVKKVAVYEPLARHVAPDLRQRLVSIFKQHRIFGGRQDEIAQLDAFVAGKDSGYLFVTGDSRSGKTALLANWIERLQEREDLSVAYHFINRQQDIAGEKDFLRTLSQQLRTLRGEGREVPAALDDLQALYRDLIAQGVPARPLVVVIDGLDEAEEWKPRERNFPFPPGPGVHVVFSARSLAGRNWLAEVQLAGRAEVLELKGLGAAAIAHLLRSAGQATKAFADDPQFVTLLGERSAGDPFYLQFRMTLGD